MYRYVSLHFSSILSHVAPLDNAAMIAWAAMGPLTAGQTDPPETELVPKWSIEDLDTAPNKGPLPKWQELEPHTTTS